MFQPAADSVPSVDQHIRFLPFAHDIVHDYFSTFIKLHSAELDPTVFSAAFVCIAGFFPNLHLRPSCSRSFADAFPKEQTFAFRQTKLISRPCMALGRTIAKLSIGHPRNSSSFPACRFQVRLICSARGAFTVRGFSGSPAP
jgi:hypothetical protein